MMGKLQLRKLKDRDVILFKKWIYKDHIAKWYPGPLSWIYEIENKNGEFDWLHHYIAVLDNIDIGFCQFYEYKNSREIWHGNVETAGTYSIDYLIGEKDYLSKGYGREIIKLLSKTILSLPNAKRIIVQPDPDNIASCNALLSAGFIFDKQNQLYKIERFGKS